MIEGIIFGTIQGVAEWLPISSDGLIVLARIYLFGGEQISDMLRYALFLHLGTMLAAIVYFHSEIIKIIKAIPHMRDSRNETAAVLRFLIVSTLVSGALGYVLFFSLVNFENYMRLSGQTVTFLTGLFLLVTAFFQFGKKETYKEARDVAFWDGILLGCAQGIAVLPGLSRSGLTVAALLFRQYNDTAALRLSFLMSVPIVLAGNIFLNIRSFAVSPELFWGLLFSFLFGIATIHALLRLAQKINFGYFTLFFGVLVILSVFI